MMLVLSYTFTATGQAVEEPVPLKNTPMWFGGPLVGALPPCGLG
jgi:hypothetical protein